MRVGFLQALYTAREDDGEVEVCVGAFEPQRFGANFSLTVDTSDGTAGAFFIATTTANQQ